MIKNSTSPLPSEAADFHNGQNHQHQQREEPHLPRGKQEAWLPPAQKSQKDSVTLSRVAMASAFIAFVLNTVGFSCAYWVTTEIEIPFVGTNEIHIGLFRGCSTFGGCRGGRDGVKTWRVAAAGLEIMAFILTVFTMASLGVFLVLHSRYHWSRWLRVIGTACTFLAGGLIIASVVLFRINIDNVLEELPGHKFDLDWAFALAANASAFCVFAGTLLVFDLLF